MRPNPRLVRVPVDGTREVTTVSDDQGVDEVESHRAWLLQRNLGVIAAVGCPRCGSAALTPCVGTSDDERHAGAELRIPHVQRFDNTSENYVTTQRYALIERHLRQEAGRRGLRMEKSRARNPRATSFGTFFLVDAATDMVLDGRPNGYGLSLDEVAERFFPQSPS